MRLLLQTFIFFPQISVSLFEKIVEYSIASAQTSTLTALSSIGFPTKLEKSIMHQTNPLCW